MRITEFFNLSMDEIEKYLKSYTIQELRDVGLESRNLVKKLNLTGINRYRSGLRGNIRLRKKINLYGVYGVNHKWNNTSYLITFHIRAGDGRHNLTIFFDSSLNFMWVSYNGYTIPTRSRIMRLKDYILYT